ncbi:monocarboxylate transporter 13-like [Ptychodera flava]|uniref:monocarboxylate transporter 13-like n=1 Tax=Ptychodera flava TaxID=63121 RepID=UPI00396AB0A7
MCTVVFGLPMSDKNKVVFRASHGQMEGTQVKQTSTDSADYLEGGYGWFVVLGLFILTFIVRGTVSSSGMVFVAFVEYFDSEAGTTSWINSISSSMSFAAGPVAAALSKKFGHRKVIFAGSFLAFTSLLLGSFSNSIWQLTLTAGFLNGLAYSLVMTPATPFIGYYFNKRQALANGLAWTGFGCGSVLMPFVFRYSLENYGWRGTLLINAALLANMCVGASFFKMPTRKRRKCRLQNPEEQSRCLFVDENVPKEVAEHKSLLHLSRVRGVMKLIYDTLDCSVFIRNYVYVIFILGGSMMSCAQFTASLYLAPIMYERDLDERQVALLLSVFGASAVVGGPLFGFLFSRLPTPLVWPLGVVYLVYGTVMYLLSLASSATSFAILHCMLGICRAIYASQSMTALRQIVGLKLYTSAFGWWQLLNGLAQLIGPSTAGYLRDFFESYRAAFILAGSMGVCGGLVLVVGSLVLQRLASNDSKPKSQEDGGVTPDVTESLTVTE